MHTVSPLYTVVPMLAALVFLAGFTAMYFLPTIIAARRHKANVVAIGALNALLGWTMLAWIGCLVWALTTDQQRRGA